MAGPYGEPISAKIFDLINNARDYAEGCNAGLGCAVATNSVYFKNQAGANAAIPALDLSALVDSSLGSYTVTLPPLAGQDHNVEIVKVSNDANVITVKCAPGDTFADGTTTYLLIDQNDFIDLLATSALKLWAVRGSRQPRCASVYMSTASSQNIPINTFVAVTYDSVDFDPLGMFANGSRLVAPITGIYVAHGSIYMGSPNETSGNNVLVIRKNGSIYYGSTYAPAAGASWNVAMGTSQLLQMNKGDYVELVFYQSALTTATLNSVPSAQTNFSAIWVQP